MFAGGLKGALGLAILPQNLHFFRCEEGIIAPQRICFKQNPHILRVDSGGIGVPRHLVRGNRIPGHIGASLLRNVFSAVFPIQNAGPLVFVCRHIDAVFADMAQRTGVAAGEPGRAVCIYFHNGFRLAKVKIHRVLIGELCPIFRIVESGIGIKIDYAVKINGTGAALDAVGELLAIEVQRTDMPKRSRLDILYRASSPYW